MNTVKSAALRASIPLVIMSVMALALQLTDKPSDARGTFIAGLITAAVAGFSVIYDIESWSLARQSAAHLGAMTVTVFPCLLLSGWFPVGGPLDVLVILGYFLAIGAVAWSIAYLIFGKLLNGSGEEPPEAS